MKPSALPWLLALALPAQALAQGDIYESAVATVLRDLGVKPAGRSTAPSECGVPLWRVQTRADGVMFIFTDACPGLNDTVDGAILFAARAEEYFAAMNEALPVGPAVAPGTRLESFNISSRGTKDGYTLGVGYPTQAKQEQDIYSGCPILVDGPNADNSPLSRDEYFTSGSTHLRKEGMGWVQYAGQVRWFGINDGGLKWNAGHIQLCRRTPKSSADAAGGRQQTGEARQQGDGGHGTLAWRWTPWDSAPRCLGSYQFNEGHSSYGVICQQP